jgi:hypothetical protein
VWTAAKARTRVASAVSDGLPYESECFFVAPIGKEGSDIRRRSDGVRDFVVKPAVAELGLQTVRADQLAKPGQITLQVVEHVLRAKAVVADLTGANPNVFYELAVRHAARLPVVLIAEEAETDTLPFDLQQMRVISLNYQDLASAARAKEQITEHLREALRGAVDSPIATVLSLEALEQGTAVERTLAEIVTRVDELAGAVAELRRDELRGLRQELSSEIARIGSQLGATASQVTTVEARIGDLVDRTATDSPRRGTELIEHPLLFDVVRKLAREERDGRLSTTLVELTELLGADQGDVGGALLRARSAGLVEWPGPEMSLPEDAAIRLTKQGHEMVSG